MTTSGKLSIVESDVADAPEIVSDPAGTESTYRRGAIGAVVLSEEPQTVVFYEELASSEWARGIRGAEKQREVEE
jgi:hypothetical protein